MYLSKIEIENFRIFGSRDGKKHLELSLNPGLNLIVGENDSGKTALIDAVRQLLGTTSHEWMRITEDDFHVESADRASELNINCEFRDLDNDEGAALLEWLTISENDQDSPFVLCLSLNAKRKEPSELKSRWDREISVSVRAGVGGEGRVMEGEARDLLRVTYLKPLRDAEEELRAKKGSRLSQILMASPEIHKQEKNDWDESKNEIEPRTLVGIMRKAEHCLQQNDAIRNSIDRINQDYLDPISLINSPVKGCISTHSHELRQILERMKLLLESRNPEDLDTRRGLGINNLLFIATEHLLIEGGGVPALPLLLIEEPEAHLHPQLQICLTEFLEDQSEHTSESRVQILMTSHSPNLASKIKLENLIVMQEGRAFPMGDKHTKLSTSDYRFLERFLDVTKANLFFAKAVLIVEGPSEALLLPTLAKLIGCPLSKYGVSIVDVGTRGLSRYSQIFQRTDGQEITVKVACVTDRDIPPYEAKGYLKQGRKTEIGCNEADYTEAEIFSEAEIKEQLDIKKCRDGGPVKTFVSDHWTLEYDLALCGLGKEVHAAVTMAKKSKGKDKVLDKAEQDKLMEEAYNKHKEWSDNDNTGKTIASWIYEPLSKNYASKPDTAQFLAQILEEKYKQKDPELRKKLPPYLVSAIEHVTDPIDESQDTGGESNENGI
jgi:putative ATP-dependent endonuclease of OLD family